MDAPTIGTSTRSPVPRAAAIAAGAGFLGIAAFQVALAAGAPLGQASWGGTYDGQLPTGLRIASAVAVGVWVLAALIVFGRGGFEVSPLPSAVLRWGTWILVAVSLVGALMNFASPSAWERFLWGPFALALAGLCVSRRPQRRRLWRRLASQESFVIAAASTPSDGKPVFAT